MGIKEAVGGLFKGVAKASHAQPDRASKMNRNEQMNGDGRNARSGYVPEPAISQRQEIDTRPAFNNQGNTQPQAQQFRNDAQSNAGQYSRREQAFASPATQQQSKRAQNPFSQQQTRQQSYQQQQYQQQQYQQQQHQQQQYQQQQHQQQQHQQQQYQQQQYQQQQYQQQQQQRQQQQRQQHPFQQQPFQQQPFQQQQATQNYRQPQSNFAQQVQQQNRQQQQRPAQPYAQAPKSSYSQTSSRMPVHVEYVIFLRKLEDCKQIIAYIKANASVFLNMEYIAASHDRQRCVDMLSGAAYALGCTMNCISSHHGMYLVSSASVSVVFDPTKASTEKKETASESPYRKRYDYAGSAQEGNHATEVGSGNSTQRPQVASRPTMDGFNSGSPTSRFQAQIQQPPVRGGFGQVMVGNNMKAI